MAISDYRNSHFCYLDVLLYLVPEVMNAKVFQKE